MKLDAPKHIVLFFINNSIPKIQRIPVFGTSKLAGSRFAEYTSNLISQILRSGSQMPKVQELDSTKYWNRSVAEENKQFKKAQTRKSWDSFKLFLAAVTMIVFITSWKLWLPFFSQ